MHAFLGELDGARILRAGVGITQVGDSYALDVETWDITPGGQVGECSFRSVDVSLKVTNGYDIGITPKVDETTLPEQFFSGAGTGVVQCQAEIAERGARLSARVRSVSLAGDVELIDIAASFVVMRRAP